MTKYLPFLLILLISCSQQATKEKDTHIVPIRKKPEIKTVSNQPPPPPPIQTYYLPLDFLIDSTGQVYFYQQQQYGWFCGTGIEWDTPPEFIDLKPKDIIQVPPTDIEEFIRLNITTLDSNERRVSIASLKDTINSVGLTKILEVFNDKGNKIKWLFRKATQEESIVLTYKQHNWKYYSDRVKWDSSKIGFPLQIKDDIDFTPPKADNK